jgi:hypothetical protein
MGKRGGRWRKGVGRGGQRKGREGDSREGAKRGSRVIAFA